MPHSHFTFFVFLFGLLSPSFGAQESSDSMDLDDSQDAELDALLDEIIFGAAAQKPTFWSGEGNISTGYGYRENVLLSQENGMDSPFAYLGLEAIGIRGASDGSDEWLVLLMLENSRFFDIDAFENETLLFTQLHYSREWQGVGVLGLGLEHMYSSQAFDASLDDFSEVSSLVVKGSQTVLATDLKFRKTSVLKLGVGQMVFDEESSDYDLLELSYLESFELGHSSEVEFSLKGVDRDYVNRYVRDDDGTVIEGNYLALREWRSRLSANRSYSFLRGDSNVELFADYSLQSARSSEYYDRSLAKFGTRLKWERESWSVFADATYYQADYDVRLGEDGRVRSDDHWRWSMEIERNLANAWILYLQFNGAEKDTNESLSSYRTNSVMLGLRLPSIRL